MSDNSIILIPVDPYHVPETALQERARDYFFELAPDSEEIELLAHESVQLFDCGGNLERIICPSCETEILETWWDARVVEDFEDGFRLSPHAMPCCGALHDLNSLTYDWPQGFARFGLDALNPDIGRLSDSARQEFELILQTPLRVIYQHF